MKRPEGKNHQWRDLAKNAPEPRREQDQHLRDLEEQPVQQEQKSNNAVVNHDAVDNLANLVSNTFENISRKEANRLEDERRYAHISTVTSQFETQKNSLLLELKQLKADAQNSVGKRKYDDAEKKYEQCLIKIVQLNTVWVNLQRDINPRQFVYSYSDAEQLKIEIGSLRRSAILTHAYDLIKEATAFTAEQHIQAQCKLHEAWPLLEQIDAQTDSYYNNVKKTVQTNAERIAWEANKETINAATKLILQICDSSTDFENLVNTLKAQRAKYAPNMAFLDGISSLLHQQLESKLTIAENALLEQRDNSLREAHGIQNRRLQSKASVLIQYAREQLLIGKVPQACDALKHGRELVRKITNIDDINHQNHTPVEMFNANINLLEEQLKQYYDNANSNSREVAITWIDCALKRRCDEKQSKIETLYYLHQNELQKIIVDTLIAQWHKFDRRPIPESLGDSIINLIFQRLKQEQIGLNKWFWHWEATVSLRHTSSDPMHQTFNLIRLAINKYQPLQNPKFIELSFPMHVSNLEAPFVPGYNSAVSLMAEVVTTGYGQIVRDEEEEENVKYSPSVPSLNSDFMPVNKFW